MASTQQQNSEADAKGNQQNASQDETDQAQATGQYFFSKEWLF